MLCLTLVKTDPCLVPDLPCVLLHSSCWPCPGYVLRSCPFQPRALSHSCLHLCHVPAMSCSPLQIGLVLCCNLSTPASCPVSLLSTTLPCPSYATCSFHSAVGSVHPDCRVLLSTPSTSVSHSRLHLCLVPVMPRVLSIPAVGSVQPGLSCVLVHSILVKCRVSLLTPVYTFAMSQSYHVFFLLSCWPCSARLSFALVHPTLVKCRVSLLTHVYTFAMSQSCHVFFPLQLLALFSQTRSCARVHPILVTCHVSLLTPVYTLAMSQSCHVCCWPCSARLGLVL